MADRDASCEAEARRITRGKGDRRSQQPLPPKESPTAAARRRKRESSQQTLGLRDLAERERRPTARHAQSRAAPSWGQRSPRRKRRRNAMPSVVPFLARRSANTPKILSSRERIDDADPEDQPGQTHRGANRAFSIVVGRLLNTVVVTLRGSLGTHGATRLAATLQDLVDGQGNLAVALNLRGLDRVHPSGLRVIAVAATSLERRRGSLRLSAPNAQVLRALDGAGLARLVGDAGVGARWGRPCDGAAPSIWAAAAGVRGSHPAGTGRGRPDGGTR